MTEQSKEVRESEPVAWRFRWKDQHHARDWRWAFTKAEALVAEMRGCEVRPVFDTHPAAPSADKLRIAVEALEKIKTGRATVTECSLIARRALAALKAEV